MTRYALVHEWLTPYATGGSELVVREMLQDIEADLFALIDFESSNPDSYLYGRAIATSFLQKFPRAKYGLQNYLPLMPLAIEQFNLEAYDVILSSSHAVAKGVLTRPHQLHICYCHTPMRYAWDLTFDYLDNSGLGKGVKGILARYFLHRLRQWDVISANQVDYFIANSHWTAQRIWRCYRRRAAVIYPPVNLERFTYREEKDDFYVTVSRLVPYKKVALIVEAFNQLGKNLVVIGGGPELEKLQKMAKPNVQILGRQPDEVVEDYLARAKAYVYAGCEDFGIVLVEAQACGTPVIAFNRGGAAEIVADGKTGILFPQQSAQAIANGVERFEAQAQDIQPEACFVRAQQFAVNIFRQSYVEFVDNCQEKWRKWRSPRSIFPGFDQW
ncbi:MULTISPECIES: glycosyltransferase [Cyanophyceae]|uniref:glycosyltransferase n=1 Tax=Cyanophyceae TaxID=3028117 RepID=UPI00016DC89A|nr:MULTISPECIES: glycosyltransferase [Cyanophyceae]ACB00412.1 glycosyltransferase [Picosynechococcus sp. PCC 7002]SMQ81505.1 Glycosyltransferase involved in cell wall bisynthesis [Synechococcus sp. 7002]